MKYHSLKEAYQSCLEGVRFFSFYSFTPFVFLAFLQKKIFFLKKRKGVCIYDSMNVRPARALKIRLRDERNPQKRIRKNGKSIRSTLRRSCLMDEKLPLNPDELM